MTDLLASLVDRALDRAPVLERRRPALFEAPGEAVFSEGLEVGKAAPLEEEATVVASLPPARDQRHFISNASVQLSSQADEPEIQSLEPGPSRRRRSHIANPPAQTDENEEEPVSVASVKDRSKPAKAEERADREVAPVIKTVESIAVAPQRLIETIVERRTEREIVEQHTKDKPAIEEARTFLQSPQPRKTTLENDGAQPKPQVKAETKSLTLPKEQTALTPAKQPKPLPRANPIPRARAASRAEQKHNSVSPAPVIHVTIGRVEVRANMPAAKPRATQPTGPKLSLDDYLRSRGGKN